MSYNRAESRNIASRQDNQDQSFNTEPFNPFENKGGGDWKSEPESYGGLVAALRENEFIKESEDIYEEGVDGVSRYETTLDHYFSPEEFFKGVPQHALEDPIFWSDLLSDPEIRGKFNLLDGDEQLKYLIYIPEHVRMNPDFSALIIAALNLERAFSYMKGEPEEEQVQWVKRFPDFAFLFEQYCRYSQD